MHSDEAAACLSQNMCTADHNISIIVLPCFTLPTSVYHITCMTFLYHPSELCVAALQHCSVHACGVYICRWLTAVWNLPAALLACINPPYFLFYMHTQPSLIPQIKYRIALLKVAHKKPVIDSWGPKQCIINCLIAVS
jgi:hypothetical protein